MIEENHDYLYYVIELFKKKYITSLLSYLFSTNVWKFFQIKILLLIIAITSESQPSSVSLVSTELISSILRASNIVVTFLSF